MRNIEIAKFIIPFLKPSNPDLLAHYYWNVSMFEYTRSEKVSESSLDSLKIAAFQGHREANYFLAKYYSGDSPHYLKYLRRSAQLGDAGAQHDLGKYLLSIGELDNAQKFLELSWDNGNSKAAITLALSKLNYIDSSEQFFKTNIELRISDGCAESSFWMGVLAFYGFFHACYSYKEIYRFFEFATSKNVERSYAMLSMLIRNRTKDYSEASKIAQQGFNKDCPYATLELASLIPMLGIESIVSDNYVSSLFEKATESGKGIFYLEYAKNLMKVCDDSNLEKIMLLLDKADKEGLSQAKTCIAVELLTADRRLTENELSLAQSIVALSDANIASFLSSYYRGRFVRGCDDERIYWDMFGAMSGECLAMYVTACFLGREESNNTEKDVSFRLLKIAAKKNYVPAIRLLSNWYLNGFYVLPNYKLSLEYLKKAARLGCEKSPIIIKELESKGTLGRPKYSKIQKYHKALKKQQSDRFIEKLADDILNSDENEDVNKSKCKVIILPMK